MNTFLTEIALVFESLARTLLLWSFQAAVLVSMVWLILRLDRPHRPKERSQVWVATLLLILLLPWTGPIAASLRELVNISQPHTQTVIERGRAVAEVVVTPAGAVVDRVERVVALSLGLTWLLGAALVLSRQLVSYRRFRHIAETATPARFSELGVVERDWSSRGGSLPPILQSGQVASPMLFGYLRPVVLLPADFSVWTTAEERTAILRHELTHVARRDHAVQCLEFILNVLFFFHPWIRIARREFERERELACDAEVLNLGSDPQAYAEGILKVAERCIRPGQAIAAVSFASRRDLSRRIDFLLGRDGAVEGRSLACAVSFPAIAALLLIFVLAAPSAAEKANVRHPTVIAGTATVDTRDHAATSGASSGFGGRVRPSVAGRSSNSHSKGTARHVSSQIPSQLSTPDAAKPIQRPGDPPGRSMRLLAPADVGQPMRLLAPADVGQPMRLLSAPSEHPMKLLDKAITREDGR